MTNPSIKWLYSTYTDAHGRTYVYTFYNRWDPVKRQSRIAQRAHVGRLCPQTGEVRLGKKFLSTHPEFEGKTWFYEDNELVQRDPEIIQEELQNAQQTQWRNDCVSVGLGWAAWKQAEKIGLLKDLEEVFGATNARHLLALAIYQLDCAGAMMNFEDWLAMNWLPKVQPLSGQRISELLAQVDQAKMDTYYSKRYNRIVERYEELLKQNAQSANTPMAIALDSTSISTYSDTICDAAYGHAKQDAHLKQVNLTLCTDYLTGDICYAYQSEGSITDIALFPNLLMRMQMNGIDLAKTLVITDRGYASLYNTQKLYNLEIPFIQGVRVIEDSIKEKFEKYDASFRSIAFIDSRLGVAARSFQDQWRADTDSGQVTIKGYLHLYHNPTKASREQMDLLKAVDSMIELRNSGARYDYDKWRQVSRFITENQGQFSRNLKALEFYAQSMGRFVIRSNAVSDPFAALSLYRMRNVVEVGFNQFKSQTGGSRMYATQSSYVGKLFIHTLAQAIRMTMLMKIKRSDLPGNPLPKDSLEKAFWQMKKLMADKPIGRNAWVVKEVPRKTRNLFEALELPVPTRVIKD